MKHTETDVWGMICNENCTTVVVLCNFVEENEVSILAGKAQPIHLIMGYIISYARYWRSLTTSLFAYVRMYVSTVDKFGVYNHYS